MKDEDEERLRQNDPEACSSTRRVAIKILTGILPEGASLNKLDKERMMGKKREASVLKRLAHLQVPFLIELETIFKIKDWPNAKLQFLPRAQEGSTSGENLAEQKEEKVEGSGEAHNHERLAGDGDETSKKEETEETAIVLVMAYHEQSLFDYLERRQRERLAGEEDQGLDLHEALVILKQMATAVARCHRHSVCHRDVKLENFQWDSTKREVRLIDFGSSGLVRPGKLFSHPCGSLSYIAPEVVQGKGYGENVDVWALGVTFYALLTGRFPFGGGSRTADNPPEVFHRIVHQRLSLPDALPAEVADLVRRMLCRDRRHRLSAEEVLAHPALSRVSTSMDDLDRIERERRRREKGKDKLEEEDQDFDISTTANNHHSIANNNHNPGDRGIKRVRHEEATAW